MNESMRRRKKLGKKKGTTEGPAMTEFGSIRYIEPSQRRRSAQSFFSFSNHQDYFTGIGHRIAAIDDSCILPIAELPIPI